MTDYKKETRKLGKLLDLTEKESNFTYAEGLVFLFFIVLGLYLFSKTESLLLSWGVFGIGVLALIVRKGIYLTKRQDKWKKENKWKT